MGHEYIIGSTLLLLAFHSFHKEIAYDLSS